ncbi:MAG: DUF4013 domain-containing protein [Puniceicoccaceae bacterium]
MEKISWRIWESQGLGRALLIGGLLFYVPIINFLLLGYFGCWARKLIMQEGMDLPEWRDGRSIVSELGRVIVPFAVWVLLPVILASTLVWALAGLLNFMHLGFFAGTLAWLPMVLVAVLSPPAIVVSLIRLYTGHTLKETLDIPEVIREVVRHLRECIFPLLQYYGLLVLGWPLLGFAVFLATLPLLAQLILVFRKMHEDLKSGAI